MDESDHHALMYVWHGQTVREEGVGEGSAHLKERWAAAYSSGARAYNIGGLR